MLKAMRFEVNSTPFGRIGEEAVSIVPLLLAVVAGHKEEQ
jgi:hypothetical protein